MAQQIDSTQAQELVQNFLAFTMARSRGDIELLLKKNGIVVPSNSTDDEILKLVYITIPKSKTFRYDLGEYFKNVYNIESRQGGEFSFVDEFFGANGMTAAQKKAARVTADNPQGKTAAGKLIQNIATPDNISNFLNMGMSVLSSKLTAKTDTATFNAAAQSEAAKTERLLAEEKLAKAQQEKQKTWVTPVIIGVVVIGIGIGLYFAFKKK